MNGVWARMWLPLLFGAFALVGVGMAVGGVVVYHNATTGRVSHVKVDECHYTGTGRGEICTGTWVVGGSLLGKGHVVIGSIEGVSSDDIGHTLKVRIHGGTAYVRSARLPIILFVLGVFIAGTLFYTAWNTYVTSAPARPRAAPTPRERQQV